MEFIVGLIFVIWFLKRVLLNREPRHKRRGGSPRVKAVKTYHVVNRFTKSARK